MKEHNQDDKWLTRKTLLHRAQDPDDESAWDDFVRYYSSFITMVLHSMAIDVDLIGDLTQEILVILWKDLPDYEYTPDRAKFRTWLSRVIRNSMINFMKRHRRIEAKHHAYSEEKWNSVREEEFEKIVDNEWRVYLTNLAMDNLKSIFSGKALEVFSLSLHGKSTEEISEELDLTVSSVYRLRGRVKDRLMTEVAHLRKQLEV